MASWLCTLNGLYAKAALLAGAFVEWGASPMPLAGVVPGWAAHKMRLYALFLDVWPGASGDRPLPDPGNLSAMGSAIETLTAALGWTGCRLRAQARSSRRGSTWGTG